MAINKTLTKIFVGLLVSLSGFSQSKKKTEPYRYFYVSYLIQDERGIISQTRYCSFAVVLKGLVSDSTFQNTARIDDSCRGHNPSYVQDYFILGIFELKNREEYDNYFKTHAYKIKE